MEFTPEQFCSEDMIAAAYSHAIRIWELQNEDNEPQCGTLGFIVGGMMAMGNIMGIYAQNMNRQQKKQFLKAMNDLAVEYARSPVISGHVRGLQ